MATEYSATLTLGYAQSNNTRDYKFSVDETALENIPANIAAFNTNLDADTKDFFIDGETYDSSTGAGRCKGIVGATAKIVETTPIDWTVSGQ